MGLMDFNFKVMETLKAKIEKLNILNISKEKKTIQIGSLDNSIHIHYHDEIGLSKEDILKLPPEAIGNFLKQKTILNLSTAFEEEPEKMKEFLAKYNPFLLTIGASAVTAGSGTFSIKNVPIPSGDFIEQLPLAIEHISVGEAVNLEIVDSLEITLFYGRGSFSTVESCFFLEFNFFNNTGSVVHILDIQLKNVTNLVRVHPRANKNIRDDSYALKFVSAGGAYNERTMIIETGSGGKTGIPLAEDYSEDEIKKLIESLNYHKKNDGDSKYFTLKYNIMIGHNKPQDIELKY